MATKRKSTKNLDPNQFNAARADGQDTILESLSYTCLRDKSRLVVNSILYGDTAK